MVVSYSIFLLHLLLGFYWIFKIAVNESDANLIIFHYCKKISFCLFAVALKNMDNSTCNMYCKFQGHWDFDRCPLNH